MSPQDEKDENGHYTIAPRRVSFDWEKTPLHWIPDEPTATHVIDVLHLLLPAGERWFVKVFKEGLPLAAARIPRSGDDRTFGLQGGVHASVASCVRSGRSNTAPVCGPLIHRRAGSGPPNRPWPHSADQVVRDPALPGPDHGRDPCRRLVAKAGDQCTQDRSGCASGSGSRPPPSRNGSWGRRPHRAVSCPRRPDGSRAWRSPRPRRYTSGRGGASYLIRHDPKLAGRLRYSLAAHNRAVRKGLLPKWKELGAAVPRYLRRSYHPSQEGSPRRAVEYLAKSPAARTAAGASARAASA